ncbi:4-hydroxythreonine-4-phosphate dehydrogenase PdxA [Alicyclobacillus dauci]|uniref:4-hydroxythreonine-4-phosphate dehydrogenase PdxA n=1 Tax=Alicyclobacillus dauci TaxID=1475485 RepID=A0ABY6ZBA5_9BACL|nr:4-hydroxythreonine-4-phosphate dehydrogenase PdxA [Alicyclobacillus dauci]WAH36354.1 4-hydroxythreonine-4-phosphate dehydrogenase PdxA [Alicyclobacillus dauci]WAH39380.1 4-hydroxythreonine-4-phosphate dehydrogenase PdxA [Alicyclobacillus dauci]
MQRPVLALTMGDPAGIGPEITVKAMLDQEVHNMSRSFVIGDVSVVEDALSFSGLTANVHKISSPAEANYEYGTIDVLDLDAIHAHDVAYGEVQESCGRAAFAYIQKSIQLAMDGAIDAVVTAPINKESLKAANVPYIGHTEMFADMTGANEEMTMFSILNLKIFFLTRHVSLAEACRLITQERVSAGIDKCVSALKQLGFENPRLAVAGLNPHAGEHGLFGHEEMEEIVPAVEMAVARGLNVTGPVPADSVFHMARMGRFDAVLSLYHDQGHIAAKMMDFERTVSVTLGLPILRTSVDHGTAFDIAGQGKASAVSMIEAVRVGAEYARSGVKLA